MNGTNDIEPSSHPLFLLNTSRKKTLQEYANTNYKEAVVGNPYPVKDPSITDKHSQV